MTATTIAPTLQSITDDLIAIIRKHTDSAGEGWSGATKVEDAGVDSFDVVELVFQIEDKYGITVSFNANTNISRETTIGELAQLILAHIDSNAASRA